MLEFSRPTPDGTLLAGRYALLDHEKALQRLMPAGGVDIVAGGPYSSGVLAGGTHFLQRGPALPDRIAAPWTLAGHAGRGQVGYEQPSVGVHREDIIAITNPFMESAFHQRAALFANGFQASGPGVVATNFCRSHGPVLSAGVFIWYR